MKKTILGMFIGIILTLGITVVADNLKASDIEYKNTNVESALNTLNNIIPEYKGDKTITPASISKIIYTANKYSKTNITINEVPSEYKLLPDQTTVTTNNLLDGYTAYDNLGHLITGTIGTECISGTFTISSAINTNAGIDIETEFSPSSFYIVFFGYDNGLAHFYNKKVDTTKVYTYVRNKNVSGTYLNLSTYYNTNGKLNAHNFSVTGTNTTAYYVACK